MIFPQSVQLHMKAPSGDALPAQGAAKVTQMVILNNPNKVGLRHINTDLTLLVNLEETFLSLCPPKSQSLELKLMSSAVQLCSLATPQHICLGTKNILYLPLYS